MLCAILTQLPSRTQFPRVSLSSRKGEGLPAKSIQTTPVRVQETVAFFSFFANVSFSFDRKKEKEMLNTIPTLSSFFKYNNYYEKEKIR